MPENRLWHRCFLVNFVKFLRIPFCIEHLWWLLLLFEVPKEQIRSLCNYHLRYYTRVKERKREVRKYSFHRVLFAELLFSFLFLHINFVLTKKDCISIKCHIKTLSFRFKCLKFITTLHNRLAVAGTYLIFLNIFLVNPPKNKSFLAFYGVKNGNVG